MDDLTAAERLLISPKSKRSDDAKIRLQAALADVHGTVWRVRRRTECTVLCGVHLLMLRDVGERVDVLSGRDLACRWRRRANKMA